MPCSPSISPASSSQPHKRPPKYSQKPHQPHQLSAPSPSNSPSERWWCGRRHRHTPISAPPSRPVDWRCGIGRIQRRAPVLAKSSDTWTELRDVGYEICSGKSALALQSPLSHKWTCDDFRYLLPNSDAVQVSISHCPTLQLNVTSVQMQVAFSNEQPLAVRAGPVQGSFITGGE